MWSINTYIYIYFFFFSILLFFANALCVDGGRKKICDRAHVDKKEVKKSDESCKAEPIIKEQIAK